MVVKLTPSTPPSPAALVSTESSGLASQAPLLTLEICRGRTAFPQRPVIGPRFFLGSGANCDLRLGGDEIPAIHSLIQTRGNQLWLEPIASTPRLLLNGEPTEGEWLRDGDVIEFGPFQLIAHIVPVRSRLLQEMTGSEPMPPIHELVEAPAEPDLETLSASELLELIEQEEAMVEEFESNRQSGAEALLQAVRRHYAESESVRVEEKPRKTFRIDLAHQPAAAGPHGAAALVEELERLCRDLNEFSNDLERRSSRISVREASYAEAAAELLDAQKHLMSQLETVAEHVSRLRAAEQQPTPPTRAIA